jgi:hypothetical protein
MHLSPAHLGLHRAVRERGHGFPPSRARSLDPNMLQQCVSSISNSEQTVGQCQYGPPSSCTVFYIRYILAPIGALLQA